MSEADAQPSAEESAEVAEGGVSDSASKPESADGAKPNGAGEAADATAPETLAQGAESKDSEAKAYWPNDWRQRVAEHISAGDEKSYKRELKRLERFTDPNGIYAMSRELESKFTSGNIIKKPGKDATEEDVAAYHKALGVPESPEDYLKGFKPENGVELGDEDMTLAKSFVEAVLPAGAPSSTVDAALNWYFNNEEEAASALDESDENYRVESERSLKDEFGPAYRRKVNSVKILFRDAPGGSDMSNENSLYAKLSGGRFPDGTLIGNDPDFIRWASGMSQALYPAHSIVEDVESGGRDISAEIKDIEKTMRQDRKAYDKDPGMQERYRELIEARDRAQALA